MRFYRHVTTLYLLYGVVAGSLLRMDGMRIRLTHRQRQIIKSTLVRYWTEWQPNPIDSILAAMGKAGIGMSNELIRAYERFRHEYEEQMNRWVNRILVAGGVMPRDLWGIGSDATEQQLEELGAVLGLGQRFPAGITDSQAQAMIDILATIKPRKPHKWMTTREASNIRRASECIDKIGKESA